MVMSRYGRISKYRRKRVKTMLQHLPTSRGEEPFEGEEVTETLAHPDHVTPSEFGRQHAWRRRKARGWLRVTFIDEGERRVVITVTPKKEGHANAH
jgi:hypothetical protein